VAGPVKWFSETQGFDFIEPEIGSTDMFLDVSAPQRAGFCGLNDGQKMSRAGSVAP
jgi:CspA family cold shock protein